MPDTGPFPLDRLVASLAGPGSTVDVSVPDGGARAYLLSLLHRVTRRPVVAVCPSQAVADRLAASLECFLGRPTDGAPGPVARFPALEWSPYEGLSPDRLAVMARLATLFRLRQGVPDPRAAVTVLPAEALLKRVAPSAALSRHSDLVVRGEDVGRDGFVARLVRAGYNRVPLVEEPGTYAVRGGVLDVFCPVYQRPARVEQWGDAVESIRFFDPADQRTLASVDELVIVPVREEVRDDTAVLAARERLSARADVEQVPSSRLRTILSDLSGGLPFFGIEALLPAFHDELHSLADHLPEAALLAVIDEPACRVALDEAADRIEDAFSRRPAGQEVRFPPSDHYLTPAEAFDQLVARAPRLCVGGAVTGESVPLRFQVSTHEGLAAEVRARQGEETSLRPLAERVHRWLADGWRVGMMVASPGRAERLRSMLKGEGFSVVVGGEGIALRAPGEDDLEPAALNLRLGSLDGGFAVEAHGLALLSADEVMGRIARGRPRRTTRSDVFQATLSDLSPGDLVVHADHGIARYGGLMRIAVEGLDQDFLFLEFSGDDKLYLPVYRLDRVQRYVGGEASRSLDRLGGVAWERKRSRAKASVRKLAMDLLQLHAQRETQGGIAFPEPDEYFRRFEADFPWEETPDQERAIEEVLADMARPRCMDRLVCGDVGYGKTEVALRAAFLAVLGGKQVAVLCPTTVLVEQHLRVFQERFAGYPVRVEGLSRLSDPAKGKAALKDLAAGKVDVMVGTHRLLSKGVAFRELGLLVVDEEHRFGVRHKERLRELKTLVDVLTLTATPIPRTLHMSMGGLKDLSIIATPPVDRQAVRTFVTRRSEDVVRKAVMSELERGGQVFFVHNRVRTLPEVHRFLQEVVPEARIVVAHGQMPGQQVEQAMLRFVRGEANLLLCTSIVESGLDIPRANTIVLDDAHTFGLASLYQLRGRVGRSDRRAFAWLLVRDPKRLTDDARRRLEVIQRFTELGAGFHVASYDLEIRGGGELLGAEQSGHIGDVGFETYMELLEEAVGELRGEEPETAVEPELSLGVEAFLPEAYVGDTGQRLVFYKRLSLARDEEEARGVEQEMVDRFGLPPSAARALIEVMVIKVLARRLGLERVDRKDGAVVLSLGAHPRVAPEAVARLLRQERTQWRIGDDLRLIRQLAPDEDRERLEPVLGALKALDACATATRR